MKLKSLALATGLAVVMMSSSAHAVLLPPVGFFEDDNKERVIDADGNLKTTGALVVGDTLVAIIKFNNVQDLGNNIVTDLTSGEFVYGISYIQIASIDGASMTFEPNADFEATYGVGALAALFTSGSGLDLSCTTIALCEGNAAGGATFGSPYMTLGFGDSSDFWTATSVLGNLSNVTLEAVHLLDSATLVAAANYALSVLDNNTGYLFDERACPLCLIFGTGGNDGLSQILGSGNVIGGAGLEGGYIARSDFDFSFAANRVPEPATLALMGMGLLGMGWSARRRTAK